MSLDFNALATKVSHIVMKINSYFRSPVDILYVYGGGTAYTDATITAAITAAGSTASTIKLAPGTWTISNDITIPANIAITIPKGAIVSVNSGKTFTINGPLDDGLWQKFSGAGTVVVGGLIPNAYCDWWGASTSSTASQNRTAIQSALNCGAATVIFTGLFTVDGPVTYGSTITIKGSVNGIMSSNKGINFLFTATGNTDLFYPTSTSDSVQYENLYLKIDASSVFGTSNWTIILHNHKGGRFSKMQRCYFYNAKGSDNGAGNYLVIGSKYSYTASPLAYIFDIWIEHNIWSGFDTDLWANGDASVPSEAGLAVGWYLYSNFFSSVNPNNTSQNNANLRLKDAKQFTIIANSLNGNGMSGGVGFPNVSCQGVTAHLSFFGNYWEGGPSGRAKIYMLDTTSYLNLFESSLSFNEITNSSGGLYSILSPYGSSFGGSQWTTNNRVHDINESLLQKVANYTLTAADSGTTVWSNVDGVVFTLPPTVAGLTFRIMNWGATTGSVQISLSPNAIDKIVGMGITGLDNKDFINTKATAKYGDSIEVVGDGIDGWYVTKVHGIWAAEA